MFYWRLDQWSFQVSKKYVIRRLSVCPLFKYVRYSDLVLISDEEKMENDDNDDGEVDDDDDLKSTILVNTVFTCVAAKHRM